MSYGVLTVIHATAGRTEEAIHAAEQAARLGPWPYNLGILAGMLEETGETRRAQELIERLHQMPAYSIPLGMLFYHLVRKQLSAAAECHERVIQYRQLQATLSIQYPWTAPLRASSHCPRLAKLMNLPEA